MSRFRAYQAKDKKWYVKTADTNGLAGGPYNTPDEAQARVDRLDVLEAAEAKRRADRAARHPDSGMNITPGYRSPDVEDARGEAAPPQPGPEFYPPWIQRNMRWGGVPKGQLPPPEWGKPQPRHNIPIDPNDPAPEYVLSERGWSIRPGTENRTYGEAEKQAERDLAKSWAEIATRPPEIAVIDGVPTFKFHPQRQLAVEWMQKHEAEKQAEEKRLQAQAEQRAKKKP